MENGFMKQTNQVAESSVVIIQISIICLSCKETVSEYNYICFTTDNNLVEKYYSIFYPSYSSFISFESIPFSFYLISSITCIINSVFIFHYNSLTFIFMKSISARTFFHDFIDCSVLSFIITKHSNFFILVFPKKKLFSIIG